MHTKGKKCEINNLNSHLKKEQNKPKASRREGMIKIKEETNKIGNNKTREKRNK